MKEFGINVSFHFPPHLKSMNLHCILLRIYGIHIEIPSIWPELAPRNFSSFRRGTMEYMLVNFGHPYTTQYEWLHLWMETDSI